MSIRSRTPPAAGRLAPYSYPSEQAPALDWCRVCVPAHLLDRSVEEGGESPQNNSGSVITMGLSTRPPSLGSDGGSDGEIIIRVGYGTAFSSHNLGKEVKEIFMYSGLPVCDLRWYGLGQ